MESLRSSATATTTAASTEDANQHVIGSGDQWQRFTLDELRCLIRLTIK
jgi:hypothetical protein